MAGMATVLGSRPMVDYLDPKIPEESYLMAFRLNFTRAISDYIVATFSSTTSMTDKLTITSEVIVVEPVFTYAEAFLGLISISSLAILSLLCKSLFDLFRGKLLYDPGSIAGNMSLVSNDDILMAKIKHLSHSGTGRLEENLAAVRFRIEYDELHTGYVYQNSIAAVASYFAASKAVQDFKGTVGLTAKAHIEFLEKVGFLYEYGKYVGSDGAVHVGLERAPFVIQRRQHGKNDGQHWWDIWGGGRYRAVNREEQRQ